MMSCLYRNIQGHRDLRTLFGDGGPDPIFLSACESGLADVSPGR